MLERILSEFHATATQLSVALLCQRPNIDSAALEGILETLERKGRIRQVEDDGATGFCQCTTCPLQTLCPPEYLWYELVPTSNVYPMGAETAPG